MGTTEEDERSSVSVCVKERKRDSERESERKRERERESVCMRENNLEKEGCNANMITRRNLILS